MTKQDIASLVLKLLGISILAIHASNFGILISLPESKSVFYPGLAMLLVFVVGLLLILASKRLAKRLIPAGDDANLRSSLSLSEVQAVAFSVIGVLIFAQALSSSIQVLGGYRLRLATAKGMWIHLSGPVVQLALGLALFFRSRGLANLWRRVQQTRPMIRGNTDCYR